MQLILITPLIFTLLPINAKAQSVNFDSQGPALSFKEISIPKVPTPSNNVLNLSAKLRKAHNSYKMASLNNGANHKSAAKKYKRYLEIKKKYESLIGETPDLKPPTPGYLCETLSGNDNPVEICDFMPRLKKYFEGSDIVKIEDLALNFTETYQNSLIPLRDKSLFKNALEIQTSLSDDKSDFWPSLLANLDKAQSSIHIHMSGMQNDSWGQTIAKILAEKVRQGVKVRMVVDKVGARMTIIHNHESEELFDFYRSNGIEVVFFKAKGLNPKDLYHFDHRKYFIIDGKTAYNTGYTIENHMKKEMFDIAVLAEGPVVNQMQASFLLNFMFNGGQFKTSDFSAFIGKYLPIPEPAGAQHAKLSINVPWQQHRITETYHDKISNASKNIFVLNPYFTNNKIMSALTRASKNGVEVTVIVPGKPENIINIKNLAYHIYKLAKNGVKIFIYWGPENYGALHAKGIMVDDNFVSMGSCNMDKLSLYHNFEQNIESKDLSFILEAKKEIFQAALQYSKPYEIPTGADKIKTILWGLATDPLDPLD